jgi:cation transport ATPase
MTDEERRVLRHDAALLDRRRADVAGVYPGDGALDPGAGQAVLGDSHVSRWMQFALTTPVVWWAGWPFFAAAGAPS